MKPQRRTSETGGQRSDGLVEQAAEQLDPGLQALERALLASS
jgi:hypothetical protein